MQLGFTTPGFYRPPNGLAYHDDWVGAPSYANGKGLVNRYDRRLRVYNWKASNSRRILSSLAKARVGTLLANWNFIGDSETESYNGSTFDQLHMWPRRMLDALTGANVPKGGSGYVHFGTGSGATADTRWTVTGSWTRAAGTMYGFCTTAGNTATFTTTDGFGTNCDIIYTNQSCALNYSVTDAAGTVLSSGALTITGAASLAALRLTGLTNAYKVTITHNGTTGQTAVLLAAAIYNTSGLMVNNFAMYGSLASGTNGWADSVTNYYNYLPVTQFAVTSPQATFCALGVNDASKPSAVDALRSIRAQLTAAQDFVLVGQYQPQATAQTTWEDYLSRLYQLADEIDCPLVDLYDHSGGFVVANALGLMGDTVHPAAAAQLDWGELIANIIAAAQDQATLVVPNVIVPFTYSGALVTTTDATTTTARWYNNTGRTLTFVKVTLAVNVAPTGAAILVDVNKNGTTMFTTQANRPTIAISANTGSATNPDVITLADGDYLTINIDQIGSTVAGTTLTATVCFT